MHIKEVYTMKKRFMAMVLAILMALSLIPAALVGWIITLIV